MKNNLSYLEGDSDDGQVDFASACETDADLSRITQLNSEAGEANRNVDNTPIGNNQPNTLPVQNENETVQDVSGEWVDDESSNGKSDSSEKSESEIDESASHGCKHYIRKCLVVAPCCDKVYPCRICHDESEDNMYSANPKTAHQMDRFSVKEIVCMECKTRQAASNACINKECNVEIFAEYYCDTCHLWDDKGAKKKIFHCEDCGICRVGGRDNYFHCQKCASCYSNVLKDSHVCLDSAMKNNCPICLEDMFTSRHSVVVLKCGHTIHDQCKKTLLNHVDYSVIRCPTCSKSIINIPNSVVNHLDRLIERTPMPEEFQNKNVTVFCNECQKKGTAKYHFYGHKCEHCGDYNTLQID